MADPAPPEMYQTQLNHGINYQPQLVIARRLQERAGVTRDPGSRCLKVLSKAITGNPMEDKTPVVV